MKAESPPLLTGSATPIDGRLHYPAVDILRGVAATMVLGFHVVVGPHWGDASRAGWPGLFRQGWAAVDLFFVISGFVITLSALAQWDRSGPAFRAPFMRRRWFRVAPLYLLTGVIYLVLVQPSLLHAGVWELGEKILGHVLFVQNLHPLTHGALNGPSWSVAVEMQFYVLMACAAPWLLRVHRILFLVGSFALAALYRWFVILALPPGESNNFHQFIYITQLPGMWDEFALGMVLALVTRSTDSRMRAWISPGRRNFIFWVTLTAIVFAVAFTVPSSAGYFPSAWMILAWRPLLGIGFAGLLCCALTMPGVGHPLWKPLRYWGDISYGIYLWHFLVITALASAPLELKGMPLLLQTLGWTMLLSVGSWHWIEKPNIAMAQGPRH